MQDAHQSDPLREARANMVELQLRRRGIRDDRLLSAMAEVPREQFIPERYRDRAYGDFPLPIGSDQTISQPYIVAAMIEPLRLQPEYKVLEIGTGTGYQAAILSRLAAEVITIERHADLAAQARQILAELHYANVRVVVGDGSNGFPEQAPYDAIIVAAAAPSVPEAMLQQLSEGGRMIIPVGPSEAQMLKLYEKHEGVCRVRNLEACRFVPLVGAGGFSEAW